MSTVTEQDLSSVDLADPALWDAGPPYELFARLQREAPVHFSRQAVAPDEGGFWSITRHEDVRAVTRDFKTFSSERRGILNVDDIGVPPGGQRLQRNSVGPPPPPPPKGPGATGGATRDFKTSSSGRRGILNVDDIGVPLDVQRLQMISMDPPRHDRLKALVTKAFKPDSVAVHEEAVSQIITDVLDSVADRERFDLVADVARPIPARVIGSLLGTPPSDDPTLVHWTNVFTAFEDPK